MTITHLSPQNAPSKILLTTGERIGDTLFCTPAIQLLKASLPDVEFDVLAFSRLAGDIFEGNPHVNKVHVATNPISIARLMNEYPLSINLMFEMLKKMGRWSKRHDSSKKFISIGEPILTVHRSQQVIDFVSDLLEVPKKANLDYEIFPLESDKKRVMKLLSEQQVNVDQDILIGCQLGCHRVAKRGWKIWRGARHRHKKVWTLEKYVELAQRLVDKNPNVKFILTGAPSERYLAKLFLEKFPSAIDLIGKTSIHDLTSLMDLLNLLVTHDTGTLHLASARKTPIVALFGPTPPVFTGPWPMQSQYAVIKRETIADIEVDEVLSVISEKLSMNCE